MMIHFFITTMSLSIGINNIYECNYLFLTSTCLWIKIPFLFLMLIGPSMITVTVKDIIWQDHRSHSFYFFVCPCSVCLSFCALYVRDLITQTRRFTFRSTSWTAWCRNIFIWGFIDKIISINWFTVAKERKMTTKY